ncbi:MAG: ferredoxin family protein [Lachnospiraceae bacterium]|nr:ferredoxin family protein [Lachnospiraceae bacterium]
MAVKRNSLELCIGCQTCYKVCPMDVFRYDSEAKKSVIAYPESCQTCGQCYLNCPTHSLGLDCSSFNYASVLSR